MTVYDIDMDYDPSQGVEEALDAYNSSNVRKRGTHHMSNDSNAARAPAPPPPGPRRAPPPALVGRPAPAPPLAGPPASPAARRLRLADATSGLVKEPLSLLLYGVEGVGKTSFGAAAPGAFILGAENGSAEIGHVKRLAPDSYEEAMGILEDLRTEEHPYKTVVVDTLDWLEPMVQEATCRRCNAASIEEIGGGWGKGYKEADQEWRAFVKALDSLRARGLNVITIAHAQLETADNPDAQQQDYKRHTLKLHKRAAGLLKEWSKAILFADFEVGTVTDKATKKVKGIATGRRLLHTRKAAHYDAKNRLWLPAELQLGWAPFWRAVEAGRQTRERFYAAIATLDDVGRSAAIEHMEQNDYTPEAAEQVITGIPGKV